MALRHFLYGDREPTPIHQIITGIILVAFILAIYGLQAEFIPDHGWTQGGGFFALSLLVILVIGAKAIEDRDGSQRFYVSSDSAFETLLAGGIRSVFYLTVLWLAFVHGFAALYTGTFGRPYQAEMEVSKQRSEFAAGCDYQVTAPDVVSGATFYLCISRDQFFRWPDKLRVRVEGQTSVLGKTVNQLQQIRAQEPGS